MELIEVSESLRKFASINTPENMFGKSARSGVGGKNKHIVNLLRLGNLLIKDNAQINKELFMIALQLHDIGRSVQWKIVQDFSDRIVNHRLAGLQNIEEFLKTENIKITLDWVVIMDVIQYHGDYDMFSSVHKESLPYVELVSIADSMENGCIGALGYLEDEKYRDDKKYIENNPEKDQKDCKIELIKFMESGTYFNKSLCDTYAEYFIFAAMLAVNACNNFGNIAKDIMKEENYFYIDVDGKEQWLDSIEGYCHIFQEHLHPEDAKLACEIIRKKCC